MDWHYRLLLLLMLWPISENDGARNMQIDDEFGLLIQAKKQPKLSQMTLVCDGRESEKEFQHIKGEWVVRTLHHHGKRYTLSELEDNPLPGIVVFSNKMPVDSSERCDIYELDIDGSQNPKRFIATVTGGEIKGWSLRGIYEVKGQTMRLHLTDLRSKSYPKGFTPSKEGALLFDLIRK